MPLDAAVMAQVSAGTSVTDATGPAYTLVAEAPTIAWVGQSGALVSGDRRYASAALDDGEASQWLRVTGFNFSIPDNAQILGVEVTIEAADLVAAESRTAAVRDAGVRLIVANVIQGNDLGTSDLWKPSSTHDLHSYWYFRRWGRFLAFPPRTFGSDSELWGLSLSPSDVNDTQFGVAIGVARPAGGPDAGNTHNVLIDSVEITIHYQVAAEASAEVAVTAAIERPSAAVAVRAAIGQEIEAEVEIRASIGFGISFSSPAAGCPTMTSAAMEVSWSLSATAQVGYRVQVFEDAAGQTELYDSGFLGGSQQTYTIPAGKLPSPATNLYVRVTVTNDGGVTVESGMQCFNTSFPTSVNVSQVAARAVGGCDDPRVLPGIRVSWAQVTEGPGETFLTYAVRRRREGETVWVTVAELGDITDTAWTDYNVEPRQRYEYSVVWRAASGVSILQSADTSPAPVASVDFEFNYLHTASLDPTDEDFTWIRLDAWDVSEAMEQEIRYVQPWGRSLPTAYVGQRLGAVITVPLREDLLTRRTRWERLQKLLELQRDRSAVLMARFGRARESRFVTIASLRAERSQKGEAPQLRLVETHYVEGI